ncbi:hypothetical protein [Piscirickettsia litoralis]|uniref:Uncharacterized protein n=1 Tax=Piscirickettsia litoralis TaxID=1891921 RepID=A0ABX3A529_9GAMM|nr:hypothetical protein [Piscirickettsia litoralis]ODN43719.1 hypothetical protein BGC07_13455 [Piscirickettsia litoralis]
MSHLQKTAGHIIHSLAIILLAGCASSTLDQHAAHHNNSHSKPGYHISLQLKEQKSWQLDRSLIDQKGYTQYYIPKDQQHELPHNIIVHYGRNVSTSLIQTMQQVSSGNKHAECKTAKTRIIQQDKNSLVFSNVLKGCVNNHELWQIYKVFNRPDGQYAIIYTAEPSQIPKTIRQHMRHVIKLAQLLKYNSK